MRRTERPAEEDLDAIADETADLLHGERVQLEPLEGGVDRRGEVGPCIGEGAVQIEDEEFDIPGSLHPFDPSTLQPFNP